MAEDWYSPTALNQVLADLQRMTTGVGTCPHCGEQLRTLKDGAIPTHDFPKPCRAVCPGSGQLPKARAETPLWKDDPSQQAKDFFESARRELLLYGFAVVKELAAMSGLLAGELQCPMCLKQVRFSVSAENGHCAARCQSAECIHAME